MPTDRDAEPDRGHVPRRRRTNGTGATQSRANRRTRQDFAMLINGARRKSVEGFLEQGAHLIDAKSELGHGEYEAMVREDLEIDPSTARKLRKIAAHPILVNRANWPALPSCWRTLHELAFLPPETLLVLIQHGEVNPNTTGAEATAFRTDRSATQRASVERRRAPSAQPRAAANGHSWVQHDEVDDPGDANDVVEDLIEEIADLFGPLRARIESIRNGHHDDAKAALADALREHAATATRLADDLAGEVDG